MMNERTFDPAALTEPQRDGLACVVCGRDYLADPIPHRPVGMVDGGQVFACTGCADRQGQAPTSATDQRRAMYRFEDAREGDYVRFTTIVSGWAGGPVDRVGRITRVTDRAVTVEVVGDNPLRRPRWTGTRLEWSGTTARIRRAEWTRRVVERVEEIDR